MIEPSDYLAEDASSNRMSGVHLGVRIHRLKFLISRYWWIIALTLMLGLAIQGYRCSQQVPRYLSASRMMVNGHVNLTQGEMYSEELMNFYGTQVALMKSPNTIARSINHVQTIHPDIPLDQTALVDAQQLPKTSIFNLYVNSANPEYAKALLEAIMDTYLSGKRGRKDQTTNEAVSAITEEIAHADAEIQKDEQQLLDFQKQNNVVFIEEQSNSASTYLVGLNNERARLIKEHDLLSLEKQDPLPNADRAGGPSTPADANAASARSQGANVALDAAQENIDKLKILRDDLGKVLKDKHPKMIALQGEIDNEEKLLQILKNKNLDSRDAYREDLELQIKNLEQQIVDWNKKSLDLSERLGTYLQLKNKRDREQTLYNQLTSSFQNVNFNKSLDQEDVVVMEPASSAVPIPPDLVKQLLIGGLGGFLLGLGVIYFINRLDDKIDSPLDVEQNIGFPLIGQIPMAIQDKRTRRVPLLLEKDKRHVLLESHRNIRSSILFRTSDIIKPRSFLITSAIPGEGKSTLAANLAITFALSGTRVLLIDADLRRGVQHALFDVPLSPGISDYLQNEMSWRDIVQQTQYQNLHLIARGKVPFQAGDLLLGEAADVLLRESMTLYDMVLWDSAPLLAADDASNLCSKVGGVLFVARVRFSSIHAVRSAMEELSHRNAKIFGVMLNGVEPNQPGYSNRYRYKEYYATVEEK